MEKYDICTQYIALTPYMLVQKCVLLCREGFGQLHASHPLDNPCLPCSGIPEEGGRQQQQQELVPQDSGQTATAQQQQQQQQEQALHVRAGAWSWATGRLRNLEVN